MNVVFMCTRIWRVIVNDDCLVSTMYAYGELVFNPNIKVNGNCCQTIIVKPDNVWPRQVSSILACRASCGAKHR